MNKKSDNIKLNTNSLVLPMVIFFIGIMIAAAIFFGLKSQGNQANNKINEEKTPQAQVNPPAAQEGEDKTAITSIDDDAILGDKNTAELAIVEFSDYECPFCSRFRDQTLDQIITDYVDTGKAIFVYRDLPLGFHNPAAEREAMAAECARDQGGDKAYYEFHDLIFANTEANGKGISVAELGNLAQEAGLNNAKLVDCIESDQFKDEVAKDITDAGKAGISGTPGFVVGKLAKDGSVEGVLISGAQPYSVFQQVIEDQLN